MGRRSWLLSLSAGLCATRSARSAAGPAWRQPLSVRTVEGKLLDVPKQGGKGVLVGFMTTTCPSRKLASAGIAKLHQEFEKDGFLPVVIGIDPQAAAVLPVCRNLYGLKCPAGLVPREDVLRFLEHPADRPLMVPTLVLLGRRGRIVKKQVGWTGEEELRSAINVALKQKPQNPQGSRR